MQGDVSDAVMADCAIPGWDEAERVRRLEAYHILDTPRDPAFDDITSLAATICEAPIAIINFLGADRQWFKAEIGVGVDTLPIDDSICRFAILQPGIFVVPDLTKDRRFDGNPLVHCAGGLRFYAGALLETEDGLPLGTICVLDRVARPAGITPAQREGLRVLANQVLRLLDHHLTAHNQAFLSGLTKRLETKQSAEALATSAAAALAAHLNLARCGFAQIDAAQNWCQVEVEWSDGTVPVLRAPWRLSDLGERFLADMLGGVTIAISDFGRDPRTRSGNATAAFESIGTRAILDVPLLREGRIVAILLCHATAPRSWSTADVALVEEFSRRVWVAYDRSRVAESALARENELATLIDSAPIGIAYFSRDHRYLKINGELAAINGIAAVDHIGHRIEELLPTTATAVAPLIDQVFTTGQAIRDFEVSGTTPRAPDDLRHWLTAFFPVFAGVEREVVSVGAWVVEITDRRRAELAHARNETMLRQAQELGGIGSWEWDHATGLVHASRSYCTIHDLPPAPSIGAGALISIILEEDRADFIASAQSGQITGKRMVVDYRIRTRDGQIRHIRGVGQTLGDPKAGARRSSGIVEDVTDQRRVITALASSEALFRAVYDTAAVGIAQVAADGRILHANPRFCAILGIEAATQEHFRDITHPDDIAEDMRQFNRLLAGEADNYSMEKRYLRADGQVVWATLAVVIVRHADGTPSFFVSVIEDITKRKTLEAQLAEINARLEQRVAERTRELRHANRDLAKEIERRAELQAQTVQSQKLEALGQMTAGMAHDFNNMLAAVAGGFDLVARWSDSPRVLEVANHGAEAAQRGGAMVKQMLAFARQQRLSLRPVELPALFAYLQPLLERAAPGIGVTIDCPADIPAIRTDSGGLEAALINFAVNAGHAMPQGGALTITVRRASEADREGCSDLPGTDFVRVDVTDTGVGMSPDVLERAVEPFFTTKEVNRGTGLGLATAHGFANQSGGTLRIASTVGQGTTVTLILPCASPDDLMLMPPADTTTTPRPTRPCQFLLVDDDPLVRAITASHLRDMGHKVLEASNAAEALAHADPIEAIDGVICDVMMPHTDGVALAAQLRERRADLRLMFMTGNAEQARLAGERVIDKPFTRDHLAHAIGEMLHAD